MPTTASNSLSKSLLNVRGRGHKIAYNTAKFQTRQNKGTLIDTLVPTRCWENFEAPLRLIKDFGYVVLVLPVSQVKLLILSTFEWDVALWKVI